MDDWRVQARRGFQDEQLAKLKKKYGEALKNEQILTQDDGRRALFAERTDPATGKVNYAYFNAINACEAYQAAQLKEAAYSSQPVNKNNGNQELQSKKNPDPELSITPEELYVAYQQNEVAADKHYKMKRVEITGKVKRVGKNFDTGNPHVDLIVQGTHDIYVIQCQFDESSQDKLVDLFPSREITLRGTVLGRGSWGGGSVYLTNCSIRN